MHTAVSLLVYVLASDPADSVLVNVGAVAVITYVDVYEEELIVTVRDTLDTTNVTSAVAALYRAVAAAAARTTQLPAAE